MRARRSRAERLGERDGFAVRSREGRVEVERSRLVGEEAVVRIEDVFDQDRVVDGQVADRRRPLERRVVHLLDSWRRFCILSIGAGKKPQQALLNTARTRRRAEHC